MDKNNLETVEKDIEEIEHFIQQSKRPNITRVLKDQLLLLRSTHKSEKEKYEKESKSNDSNNNIIKSENTINYVSLMKYSFENSDKFAKVYFIDDFPNLKDHPSDKIKSTFYETGFEVIVNDWKGKNFRFACNNLNKKIVPSESKVKATSTGLIVSLKKEKTEHWDSLEKKKSMISEPSENTLDKNADPSAGLMNMMKEMYQNGDENTKRMIAESWMKAQDGKSMGGMPDMGGMGGMGGMPDMSKFGGMGGMPDMSKFGGMDGMPDMSKFGGKGGMPDMSKLLESMGGDMPDFSKMGK